MTNPCSVQYVDHVGIAVRDLAAAARFLQETFGVPLGEVKELADQGVIATLMPVGQTRIELLQPLSSDSTVGRFIERRGEGLHHLALHVENLPEALEGLSTSGVELVDREPREGLSGLIAFVHPRSVYGVLTELVQKP